MFNNVCLVIDVFFFFAFRYDVLFALSVMFLFLYDPCALLCVNCLCVYSVASSRCGEPRQARKHATKIKEKTKNKQNKLKEINKTN